MAVIEDLKGAHLRHRRVAERDVAGQRVVAHPTNGSALVLAATAAEVRCVLDDWQTVAGLRGLLAARYSHVPLDEREHALEGILLRLCREGLLERHTP